jgi:protease I
MQVLFLTADGFEDTELLCPYYRLREAGYQVDIAAPEWGEITGKHGYKVHANLAVNEVSPDPYRLLFIPGGKAPSNLRLIPEVLNLVRAFHQQRKPIAAICHGPLVLLSAGILKGRRATAYHKVAMELQANGVNYLDDQVVIDENLITSRQPSDIPAFMKAVITVLGIA